MKSLDLWKKIEKLSVDEFMCLLFGLEPGTVKFDYGNPKDWPENADLIYRILTDDIQAKKLHVSFDEICGDPFYNGAYDRFYAGTDNPWWADGCDLHTVGKLHKHDLVKWLAGKKILSDFFNTATTATAVSNHKSNTEPKAQIPVQDIVTERKPMKTDNALLINFEEIINVDPTKITPQLVANNYLLIGILLDFIVGEAKDLKPKNQSKLTEYIVDKYYKDGLNSVSKRNVDKKFAIANTLKAMLDKAKNQLDEALSDTCL